MSELIDRVEAQTEIQFAARRYTVAHEAHGEGRVVWSDSLISVEDAMNALRKVPSAQPAQQWNPCSKGNPIFDGEYLVTFADEDGEWIGTAEWNTTLGGRWQVDCFGECYCDVNNVIAWMLPPAPYRGGTKNG